MPHVRGVPVGVLLVNVVGAFLLGLLLRAGPDTGPRLDLRLLLGTGFLGGSTTYSALATDTVALLVTGAAGRALAYALGTLVLGLVAGPAAGAALSSSVQLVAGSGFLGGCTTFSTASVETVRLARDRLWGRRCCTGWGCSSARSPWRPPGGGSGPARHTEP